MSYARCKFCRVRYREKDVEDDPSYSEVHMDCEPFVRNLISTLRGQVEALTDTVDALREKHNDFWSKPSDGQ